MRYLEEILDLNYSSIPQNMTYYFHKMSHKRLTSRNLKNVYHSKKSNISKLWKGFKQIFLQIGHKRPQSHENIINVISQ